MKTERGLRFELENVSAEDARFISEVLALFTDPARAQDLADLKAMERVIAFHPPNGAARIEWRWMKN